MSDASILARFTKLLTAQRYQTRGPLYVLLWVFWYLTIRVLLHLYSPNLKTLKAYTSSPQDTANYELNRNNRVFRSRQLKLNNAALCREQKTTLRLMHTLSIAPALPRYHASLHVKGAKKPLIIYTLRDNNMLRICPIARVGFNPLGHTLTQFMIPRQRNTLNGSSRSAKRSSVAVSRLSAKKR